MTWTMTSPPTADRLLELGYVASPELLTRTETESDFATDVCVRREGVDPQTGGRHLEELAFEVANTQTRKDLEEVRIPGGTPPALGRGGRGATRRRALGSSGRWLVVETKAG